MYFYKDTDGLYHLAEAVYPPGSHILQKFENDTVVSVRSIKGDVYALGATEITKIQKENGSYYTDLNDLLNAIGDFFL